MFNLRYPGQYYDNETGLHYNYYRDYDPQTGRYIQSDPVGLNGGINTYSYVYGNPEVLTDASGLDAIDDGKAASKRIWKIGSLIKKYSGERRRNCKIKEIKKRRMMCDILIEKFGSGGPMTPSEQWATEYLYSQTRRDAVTSADIGIQYAKTALTEGISMGRGSFVKGVGKFVGNTIIRDAADDDDISLDPNAWHIETSAECED